MQPFTKQLIFLSIAILVFGIGVYTVIAVNNRGSAPVAYWKFDEGYGPTAFDSAGSNDGTITNAAWRNEPDCKSGKCLYFDGDGDLVSVGAGPAVVNTVSFWIKPLNTTNYFIDLNGSAYISASSGTISATGFTSPTIYVNGIVSSTIQANLWQFVSVTTGTAINASALSIGKISTNYLNGFLDDVRIYDYARSAAQIKADYMGGASRGSSVGTRHGAFLQNQSEGLVGHWKMDESSDNAADSSGVGTTLTNTGTATFAAGKYGNAADLESGSSQYFYAADNATVSITNDLTISAWLKPESNTADTLFDIVAKWDGANESYVLAQFGDEIRLYIDSSSNYKTTDAANLATGAWYFISAVYNARTGTIRLYVDGQERVGTITGAIPTSIADDASRFHIGAEDSSGTPANFYDGIIDDVRIYKTARSATQIMLDYETGPPPVAYWRMDEKVSGDAKTIYDTSGSNNGTTVDGANNTGMNCAKPGKYGSACEFDGVDDYVSVGTTGVSNTTGTASAWVKYNSVTTNDDYVLGSRTAAGGRLYLAYTNANNYSLGLGDDGAIDTGVAVTTGVWHHLSLTWSSGSYVWYLDGVNRKSGSYTGNPSVGNVILIGAVDSDDVPLSGYFNGLIDDVRIYNYARTQKQVIEDMMGGRPPLSPPLAKGGTIGGYVGYWNFDEGYGTTAYDKSNNSKDLTLSAASWTLNGKFGSAFDGGDNKRVADGADDNDLDFEAAENFTLSAWFNRGAISNAEYIIYKENGNEGYALYLDGSGDVIFGIGDTNSASFPEESVGNLAVDYDNGVWHHAVAVKTGTSRIDLYVDGILIASDASLIVDATLENAGILYIGDANATDGTDEFLGDIDEVKIYPFALNPAEIKQEYNQGKTMVLGSPRTTGSTWDDGGFGGEPPVAIWKMDEKTGQYAWDSSGSGNTGTLGTGSSPDGSDPAWKSAGECKKGGCLSFDGVDDYVNMGDPASGALDMGTSDFTIGFWAKSNSATQAPCFVHKMHGSGYGYRFYGGSLGGIIGRFSFGIGNSIDGWNGDNAKFDTTYYDLNWHYLVLVADRDGNATMYNNGALVSSASISAYQNSIDVASYFQLGLKDVGTVVRMNGLIDDVRIYNYARTPAQIAWDYNHGKPKLHFKFDENTGATAYDYYKTKNGTITGPDWTGGADQCKFNYCLDFTPANTDYVDVGNTGIAANLYSVSFWIYPDSVTSQNIIDFDGGTHKIITDASGNLTANGWSSPTIYVNGRPQGSPLQTGQWQHVFITTATAFNPNDTDFGRVATNYFDGRLDEIKFYTYPLTAAQVKQDYQGGAVRIGPGEGLP